MSVTIRDVARRAGVSVSTVSRVLNGTARVGEDKRAVVEEAVEALGYSPNPAALSLRSKQTGGLGVLLPFVSGEFFSELLSGLDEAVQTGGRFLLVSTSHRKPADFRRAVQALNKRVDGLIVMAPELNAEGATSLLKTEAPVVFVNTYAEGLEADVINFDNRGGVRALTQHLLGLGHRHIALLHGPPEAGDAQERAQGYREALAKAGLEGAAVEIPAGYTREAGEDAAREALSRAPRPTALIAANDHCAFGVLSALREAGVAVPEAMSVCGFDGLASAGYTVPPLTTAQVPIREIGRWAVRRLEERLAGDRSEPHSEVMPVEILVRESTAPPASGS